MFFIQYYCRLLALSKGVVFCWMRKHSESQDNFQKRTKTPRISKMQRFVTIVYGLKPLATAEKLSILNVRGGSGYVSDFLIYFKSCRQKFPKKTTLKTFVKIKSLICNFLKKETRQICFLIRFVKFPRTFSSQNICQWHFLQFSHQSILKMPSKFSKFDKL